MPGRKELYRSPNGDAWFLTRDPSDGRAYVLHEPNLASGGQPSHIEIGAFFQPGADGPEHQALLRLIGTLVEGPRITGALLPGSAVPSPAAHKSPEFRKEWGYFDRLTDEIDPLCTRELTSWIAVSKHAVLVT